MIWGWLDLPTVIKSTKNTAVKICGISKYSNIKMLMGNMWESDDKPTMVYVSLRFGPPWFTTLYYSNWGSCKPAGQGSMKNRSEKLFIMDHGLMLMICEICVGFLGKFHILDFIWCIDSNKWDILCVQ